MLDVLQERTDGRIGLTPTLDATRALLESEFYTEVVHYIMRHNKVAREVADRQVIECLRYLYLISAYREQLSGLFLPVEQAIDEVWHYLILQTREYRYLCEMCLPGGFFIEHRSLSYANYGNTPSREQLIEESLRWLPLYCRSFGPFDQEALAAWTMARFLFEEMGLSLVEIACLDKEKAI